METIDDEVTAGAIQFANKAAKDANPSSCGGTRRGCTSSRTSARSGRARATLGITADGMLEHDNDVGLLLAELKKLGLDENTIVVVLHRQRCGVVHLARRRHDHLPRQKEHAVGRRLPRPDPDPLAGVVKPGTTINDFAHGDMVPTLLAAAGDTTVKEDLLKRAARSAPMTYKVHLDGYNLLPFFKGRREGVAAPRLHLLDRRRRRRRAARRLGCRSCARTPSASGLESPFEELRWPLLTNLRMDPLSSARQMSP